MERDMREDKKLSASESVIMKVIWDYTKENQPLSIPDLISKIKETQGIDYARTTVVTFLLKLSDKRFVETYRKGKLSYVYPVKSLEWYRMKLMQDQRDFWYNGDVEKMNEDMQILMQNSNIDPFNEEM